MKRLRENITACVVEVVNLWKKEMIDTHLQNVLTYNYKILNEY